MKRFTFFLTALLAVSVSAYAQLAQTPQMGWSTWNKFATGINEELLKATADKMVELGLVDAGYIYFNIDDGWHGSRDEQGFIHPDPEKFPSGMKAMADYIHSKGMKMGIYSDAGRKTCGCFAGSLGHEYQDAYTYAQWGVDYLKYDWCYTENINPKGAYRLMHDAIKSTGREIFLSMCEWGQSKPWEWASDFAQSWRTTGDIWPYFDTIPEEFLSGFHGSPIMTLVDKNEPLREYAGPGHWNDPDMLEVGNGMSVAEDRAHFSLWCMMAAPLILGNDLTNMSQQTLDIILNKEAIAIDQDPLGVQGLRLRAEGNIEYWLKPLQNGDWAVLVLNRGAEQEKVTLDWNSLKHYDAFSGRTFDPTECKAHNIWDKKARTLKTNKPVKLTIASHDVVMYRVCK